MPHFAGQNVRVPHLRPLRASDAPAVLAAFAADPEMSRQGTVRDLTEAREYVRRHTTPGVLAHAVCVETDALVGLVVIQVDAENRTGWFSYWTHPEHRGRGWTARAAATVATWALTGGGLERLELGHRANNPASGAVARAAGFVHEGTEREKFLIEGRRIDVLTYGRLRADPAPDLEPLALEPVRSACTSTGPGSR